MAVLRPQRLLEVLTANNVDFVLVGGVAERILGSPRSTDDFDICPAGDAANLERLAHALNELGARWRVEGGDEQGFPPVEAWNARSFGSHTSLALTTRFGGLDVWFRPDGTSGYGDLAVKAIDFEIGGAHVKVIHPDDSIRIKRTIGGPKYLSHLPLLRELQQRRAKNDG